jgi:uncharacterized protein YdeI (YjbR/CyaY-like superfamily)
MRQSSFFHALPQCGVPGSSQPEEHSMKSPQFDKYISKAAPFARPILEKIRRCFHEACSEIEEKIKWGHPHFAYKGPVGGMAAFKQHVGYGFWKGALLRDSHHLFDETGNMSMMGTKVSDVSELPSEKVLVAYIRDAVALNEQGIKKPAAKKKPKKEIEVPDYFLKALKKNKKALATFEAFSSSHRREYLEWLTEAKQEATRQKRLATAIEWLAEGKPRNWKYMKSPKSKV